MWSIDSIAVYNNRIWFASSHFQDPKSAARKIDFTLEDRAIFNCNPAGEDFRSLALRDGLPKAEIATMQAAGDRLFLGTQGPMTIGKWNVPGPYGLLVMSEDREFEVFEATETFYRKLRVTGVSQMLVLEDQVVAAFGNTLKVLKYTSDN